MGVKLLDIAPVDTLIRRRRMVCGRTSTMMLGTKSSTVLMSGEVSRSGRTGVKVGTRIVLNAPGSAGPRSATSATLTESARVSRAGLGLLAYASVTSKGAY